MQFTGEHHIAAPMDRVWAGLNDTDVLKAAIPGCEELIRVSETELTARVRQRIGPVSATFESKVLLSDLDPPHGYRISGQGSGGIAGFAKGGAQISLAEEGGGTRLHYEADVQMGGKIAQLGGRLIQGAANSIADQFFGEFSEIVVTGGRPAAAAGPPVAVTAGVRAAPPARPGSEFVSWRTFALAGWMTAATFAAISILLILVE